MDFAGKALEIRKLRPKSRLESTCDRYNEIWVECYYIIFVEYIHMNSGVVHVYAFRQSKALNSDDGFKLWNILSNFADNLE